MPFMDPMGDDNLQMVAVSFTHDLGSEANYLWLYVAIVVVVVVVAASSV